MTRGQKIFGVAYEGSIGVSALFLLAFVMVAALSGCGTEERLSLDPTTDRVVSATSQTYVAYVEVEGKRQKALVMEDASGRWEVNGVSVKVIMVLDYPCGFVGPLPEGHGRDCTDDPNGTPSTEPPTARYIGDPTSDE